ncbi:hypothetical protein OHB12_06855 [Nocardia sp. NBC_01730]|uniref:hypothetical protein n=1 Tax=Nocardia sp. NBC_01730 TaxID=2975998 RepID=UPI002E0D87E9|nr:hypothetical protein OHB12_06855 [Nocardia sp. NBC_01730]
MPAIWALDAAHKVSGPGVQISDPEHNCADIRAADALLPHARLRRRLVAVHPALAKPA